MGSMDHVNWLNAVVKLVTESDSDDEKAEVLLRATDKFNTMSPQEKADIFIVMISHVAKINQNEE